MIKMVAFNPDHLAKIDLQDAQKDERPDFIVGTAFTFLAGDEVIAIVGYHFIMAGVVQVWSLLSSTAKRHPLSLTKAIRTLIEFHEQELNLRRIQMMVKVGYQAGWRWARTLGFREEGLMKNYRPTGDSWLFARTR